MNETLLGITIVVFVLLSGTLLVWSLIRFVRLWWRGEFSKPRTLDEQVLSIKNELRRPYGLAMIVLTALALLLGVYFLLFGAQL
jgi:hypothetical protein